MRDVNLHAQATNPCQYDAPEAGWSQEVGLDSPMRAFYWRHVAAHVREFLGKDVIDIGAGSGWLLHQAKRSGAARVVGIEPLGRNIALGLERFPRIKLVESTLETYPATEPFDIVFSLMSFPHIADLAQAFVRIRALLKPGGSAYLIVPDYDYFRRPKFGYPIVVEPLSEDEYVVSVTRTSGTIVDVVRREHLYVQAAQAAGLTCTLHLGLKPDEALMAQLPRYREFAGTPLFQWLAFKKG